MHTKINLNSLAKNELIDMIYSAQKKVQSVENLLANINGISWEFDLVNNNFTSVSPTTEKILGYTADEWYNFDSRKNMIHEDEREQVASYCATQTQDGKDHFMEYKMIKKNGDVIWVLDVVTLGQDKNGTTTKLYGFILDVTDSKKSQLQLEKEHTFLQKVIDSIAYPIMLINHDYSVTMMNAARTKGIAGRDFIDNNSPKCYEISHNKNSPCNGKGHECPLHITLETKKTTHTVHKHKNPDGSESFFKISAAPMFDDEQNCTGIIETAIDITEQINLQNSLKESNKKLTHLAHHDYLTGLPNRALFMDRLSQTIKDSKRNKIKSALFFIDLDHFKEVNDNYGHDMGDAVLKESSQRFLSCIRENDTLARLAGDEFTIIIKDIKSKNDIQEIAEKIIKIITQVMKLNSHEIYISASIGISIFPDDANSAEDILLYSDDAMYKAKAKGKNNFHFYN